MELAFLHLRRLEFTNELDKIVIFIKICPDGIMNRTDEVLIKVAKEIVIKFIEIGRLGPNTFEENWNSIYETLKKSVNTSVNAPDEEKT